MPANIANALQRHNERVNNALGGNGFRTNEEVNQDIRIIWWVDEQGNLHLQFEQPIQVTTYIDDSFGAYLAAYHSWPPKLPLKNFGWPNPRPTAGPPRAVLPEGMSETPRTGTESTKIPENPFRPGIDPREGGVRPGATGWERAKAGGALIFRVLIRILSPGIIIIDFVGPVVLPYTIGVCARNPQACDPNYRRMY